jgi:hypothetical protein
MPRREDVPPEVQAITRRNALELGDQRWRYDVAASAFSAGLRRCATKRPVVVVREGD